MNSSQLSIFYSLCYTFCFGLSCVAYDYFAKKVSPLWINTLKATITFFLILLTAYLTGGLLSFQGGAISWLALSGVFGLGVGDLFLLMAFKKMGAGRTLVIYGLHPFFVGILSYLFFAQGMPLQQLIAILFLVACLLTLSYEGKKESGTWEKKGILLAVTGVLLDASGVIISRHVFDHSDYSAAEVHLYRCWGALIFFALYSYIKPIKLRENFQKLSSREQLLAVVCSISGLYLALLFHLQSIKLGHLATISAIGGTTPLLATVFETLFFKKPFTRYLLLALIFYSLGMAITLF